MGYCRTRLFFSTPPANNTRSVDIGVAWGGGTLTRFFNGLIDEAQYFNRALSASEIQAIFNAGGAGQCKPALVIQPTSLPDGAMGLPYTQTITAGAGTPPYTFTVSNGSLPPGLSLSSGGMITGTPQATGSSNFTVQVTDANNTTAQRAYSITIVPGCVTPPPNMVGWYPGDGNAVDIQGGNNGTLMNGATFAPGEVDQAFQFTGGSERVFIADSPSLAITASLTLDAWVNAASTPPNGIGDIIFRGDDRPNLDPYTLRMVGSNVYFQVSDAVGNSASVQAPLPLNQFVHVAGTLDDATGIMTLYLNGISAAQTTTNVRPFGTLTGANPGVSIGNLQSNTRLEPFIGLIDEVEVFDRALTQSEVQAIFNAGIAGKCKSPSPNFCGVISGQITDAQGPLQGALVQACEPNNGPCSFNATTDAAGNYQITGLPLNTPFDLTVFPPQGSVAVPGELLDLSVQSCSSALTNQDLMLQAPAPPPSGTDIEPHNNGGGGVPTVYWQSPLTLTTTGCPNGTASYIISRGFSIFASGPMTETPPGSGTFTASVPALFPAHGAATVSMTIDCGGSTITIGFDLYIDPSGTVRDNHGAPVSGATVTLFRSDTPMGPFDIVPDGSAVMSPGNRHNPDMTDSDGHFGWDVLSGFYKVRAEKDGCNGVVETGVLQIPPPVTDLVLTLDCPTELLSAVSRKTHGAAGDFDIDLPLTGTPGIEDRTGGATNDYTMVATFSGNVSVTGSPQAEVISGTGCVGIGGACSGNVTVSGNIVTVPLTNIANAQTINVRINGVNSAADRPATDVSIPMNILIGDTNDNGSVNSSDVAQTKSRVGHLLDETNFRSDVNANGAINSTDVSIIKSHLGTGLP